VPERLSATTASWMIAMFVLLTFALLTEVASRRSRGAS
jgi:hypothetical protein